MIGAAFCSSQPAIAVDIRARLRATMYLSFDTGSQSQAELVAQTLRRHHIHATFFLANEKKVNGDYSLDPSWAGYWKKRAEDGHASGTHTFDHTYVVRDLPNGNFAVKPQFGAHAGQTLRGTLQQNCAELQRLDQRFK